MNKKSNFELIKEYIEKCTLLKKGKVNVEYLNKKDYSYSINMVPVEPVYKKYADGGAIKQIAFDFVITLPLGSIEIENLINSAFCEEFMNWIETQNRNRIYPDIEGARSINCTSPGYVLDRTESSAIYIIQMNFKYYENYGGSVR